uniref:Cystatin domain-containing protein n=1 Tax=Strongyloides stercoralis TaxID=6248 RepID=A0AAF5D1I6_STRER
MYLKFIGLSFLIAAFIAVSSLAGFLEYTPMRYSRSALIYDLAERAIKKYNSKRKRSVDRVELCVVQAAFRKEKKRELFRVYTATFKPICTREAGNDCYPTLMAEFVKIRKNKFKLNYVQPTQKLIQSVPSCHFPE